MRPYYSNLAIIMWGVLMCAPLAVAQDSEGIDDYFDPFSEEMEEVEVEQEAPVEDEETEDAPLDDSMDMDDELIFDDDEEIVFDDDLEIEFADDVDTEETDLLGDEEEEEVGVEGTDNAALYRAAQETYEDLPADEALASWEAYLAQYPLSAFRERIHNQMELLTDVLYATQVDTGNNVASNDANKTQMEFTQPMLFDMPNPTTRIQVGFEWGMPNYMNLMVDYEYAIFRNLSVHGNVKRRYSGWDVTAGVHYALIKSPRTNTILTLMGDIHVNANPAFFGIRPQLAFGQSFGNLDIYGTLGCDIEMRNPVGVRLMGGLGATYKASPIVGFFGEIDLHMKNLSVDPDDTFRFNVIAFGLKFYPSQLGTGRRNMEIMLGSAVPYTNNYWMYHFGSINMQFAYFF